MKNFSIEQRILAARPNLSKQNVQFTDGVMDKIKNHEIISSQLRTVNVKHKETFIMKLRNLHTPALIAIACLIALATSGTAYAIYATFFLKPEVGEIQSTPLKSGNKIISIETSNCQLTSGLDGTPKATTNTTQYYELRDGSSLTDEMFRRGVLGQCEENISNNAISMIMKQLPKDTPGVYSTGPMEIKAVSDAAITVSEFLGSSDGSVTVSDGALKYPHLSDQLITYDQDTKVVYDTYKPGDSIKMILKTKDGKSTEFNDYGNEQYDVTRDVDNLEVLAIIKIPRPTSDPYLLDKHTAQDYVRVEPCSGGEAGFCRAYEF